MSNLTRLEAVSSALDTAINMANSLPDAGGGGSIETCTLSVHFVTNGIRPAQFVYADENGRCVRYTHDDPQFSGNITVNKGLFIIMPPFALNDIKYATLTGGVELIEYGGTDGGGAFNGAIFNITGDGSIHCW